ncbi:hypothetical protein PK28_16895 (plasmid) [Hymenobacter sp. DG25B]|nr:hypothetical protein PK28_16895 [Hymenobacter sp. DG25B]
MPQSEEERRASTWMPFAPLHDKVFWVPSPTADELPRILPRLGRQRLDGFRADYLYWLGAGKYGFVQPSTFHTHRDGPGWVVLRDEPGWGWEVSGPTLDLAQLRQWVEAESVAPSKLAVVYNWGIQPEQPLPASYLHEPGTNWQVTGEPTVQIPYAWASELGFTEPNPFQSGWATAPNEDAKPVPQYYPPASVTVPPARRPVPSPYQQQLPPPTEEEVWRRETDWHPFDPDKATPWRTSSQLPIYPRVGRRRPDGYRADYLYWLDADTYCFPQPDGYEEHRVGPGWVLVREEPGWGWEVSEPTTDIGDLEQLVWAKSAAPRRTAATWKWGVLPERALPEHALGGEGLSWHPDDDPLRHLPANWAEGLCFISH